MVREESVKSQRSAGRGEKSRAKRDKRNAARQRRKIVPLYLSISLVLVVKMRLVKKEGCHRFGSTIASSLMLQGRRKNVKQELRRCAEEEDESRPAKNCQEKRRNFCPRFSCWLVLFLAHKFRMIECLLPRASFFVAAKLVSLL